MAKTTGGKAAKSASKAPRTSTSKTVKSAAGSTLTQAKVKKK